MVAASGPNDRTPEAASVLSSSWQAGGPRLPEPVLDRLARGHSLLLHLPGHTLDLVKTIHELYNRTSGMKSRTAHQWLSKLDCYCLEPGEVAKVFTQHLFIIWRRSLSTACDGSKAYCTDHANATHISGASSSRPMVLVRRMRISKCPNA